MDNEQFNHDFDELLKEQLENLSEEKPAAADWESLRSELKKKEIIRDDSRWRKYLLFFLLPALLIGSISFPLLMNRYGIDWNYFSKTENAGVKNVGKLNTVNKKLVTLATPQRRSVQPGKDLSGEGEKGERENEENLRTEEEKSDSRARLLTLNAKKTTLPDVDGGHQAGITEIKNPVEGTKMDKEDNGIESKSSDTGMNDEEGEKKPAVVDSANAPSATPKPEENSTTENSPDSVTSAQPNTPAAQSDSAEAFKPKKDSLVNESRLNSSPWVGVYDSWDFTTYHLRENSSFAGEAKDVMNSANIDGINSLAQYTIGIMGGMRITRKAALEAGAFFSQKRKLSDNIYGNAVTGEQGEQSFSDFAYHYSAKYIEAYGRVKYYFLEKKHSFYLTAGVVGSFNFPSSKKDRGYFERTTYSEAAASQSDRVTLQAKSAGFSIAVSAGMEWILNEHWNIFIEPAYKHALTPVVLHPDYNKLPVEHFWRTFSAGTGLMYKF